MSGQAELSSINLLHADWPAPDGIRAVVTTRSGGVSAAPYQSFNLATHVGDENASVMQNRQRLQALVGTPHEPQWLDQVHGVQVIEALPGQASVQADAVVTSVQGLPCAVLTADCLPVFFCSTSGDRVGVAHAGWRGLAAGVLEQTLGAMRVPAGELIAWLGPAIGSGHFEVGPEVRQVFLEDSADFESGFKASSLKEGHWFADIYHLARVRMQMNGLDRIFGGDFCTFADQDRFYSYRRDGITGRMASLIWLETC